MPLYPSRIPITPFSWHLLLVLLLLLLHLGSRRLTTHDPVVVISSRVSVASERDGFHLPPPPTRPKEQRGLQLGPDYNNNIVHQHQHQKQQQWHPEVAAVLVVDLLPRRLHSTLATEAEPARHRHQTRAGRADEHQKQQQQQQQIHDIAPVSATRRNYGNEGKQISSVIIVVCYTYLNE